MRSNEEYEKLFSEFPPPAASEWDERIRKDLKGADYNKKLYWHTDEGFDVRPFYRKEDIEALTGSFLPDTPPYTRGTKKDHNNWIIRQDISCQSPAAANKIAADAVKKGVDSIGFCAKEITNHKQIGELLRDIDLERTEIVFNSSRSYPLTLELFLYEIMERKADGKKVTGSLNFDPLSYLLLYGDFYVSWNNNIEEAEYLLKTAQKKVPRFRIITVNGQYIRNAGGTVVQELAFSLSSANEYLSSLTEKAISIDSIAPRIQFAFSTGSDYFMEIAKLRAARQLWSQLVDLYHPAKKDSTRMFIHSATAMWNKTIYDPHVNMLRTTVEGMAAAIGNSDSVAILPFDATYKKEDDFSLRIARNQQLILKEESYLNKIVDPSGGSYYIENLTNSIATHAWNLFRSVEEKGGLVECIKNGFIQDEVEKSRRKKEADISLRKKIMIGTNQYPELNETMLGKIEPAEIRDYEHVVSKYKKLTLQRGSRHLEEIRLATETFVKNGGTLPKIFLFTFGNLAWRKARANFAINFFGCAGLPVIDNPGFQTIEAGVIKAVASGAGIVIICSSDEEYPEIVPPIAESLKKQNPAIKILVAGYPVNSIDILKAAGADDFIHARSNVVEMLRKFQAEAGMLIKN